MSKRPDSARFVTKRSEVDPSTSVVTMEVSSAFVEFLAKLEDFGYLIEKGDHFKAAIVGGDIQMTLDRFDPRDFFPSLLSQFSEKFHAHANELAEHARDRQSFRWKSHVQFYKVDRETFVRGREPK